MKLSIYFDGSCGPRNPGGTAAWGFVVKNEEGEVIHKASGRVGENSTHNVAEYVGLIESMQYVAKQHPHADAIFYGDSTLVISQMRGEAKARRGKYLPYHQKAVELAASFILQGKWEFRWIQRALNSEADELAQYHRY